MSCGVFYSARFALVYHFAARFQSQAGPAPGKPGTGPACECSKKTTDCALNVLEAAHIPLKYDRRQRAYVLPDKEWALTVGSLATYDALAFALTLSLLSGSIKAYHKGSEFFYSPHTRG